MNNNINFDLDSFYNCRDYLDLINLKTKQMSECLNYINQKYKIDSVKIYEDRFFIVCDKALNYNINYHNYKLKNSIDISMSIYLEDNFNNFKIFLFPSDTFLGNSKRLFYFDFENNSIYIEDYNVLNISEENKKDLDFFVKEKCREVFLKNPEAVFSKYSYQSQLLLDFIRTINIFK